VLRAAADRKAVDDFHGRRVDHADVVRAQVRHVHAFQVALDHGGEVRGTRLAVDVLRIDDGRHAGHGRDGGRLRGGWRNRGRRGGTAGARQDDAAAGQDGQCHDGTDDGFG
jgi:hypothetical protein